ncbi:unnamed protein product, partial [Coregonus sp. 'balchen']
MLRRQRTDSLLTVLLWLLFFIAMTMKQAYGQAICSQEIHQIVRKFIKEEVHKMQKCPRSTLECFTKEVKVLVLESRNKSSPLHKNKLTRRMIYLTSLIKQANGANCPHCEVHREQAVNDFLTTLLDILEWMNNQGC